MKYNYKPKSQLEKFGARIFSLIVENFSQTFYVGGMVRDLLLGKKIIDIDIATSARPDEITDLLEKNKIICDQKGSQFGVITAKHKNLCLEIATFRTEKYFYSRYPKIKFINSAEADSKRRDFTMNSLYFSPKNSKILDFNSGLRDIAEKKLRFVGAPDRRIKEDPLRIIRAIRFLVTRSLKLEHKTGQVLKKNFYFAKNLSQNKFLAELDKIKSPAQKKIAKTILADKKLLDNYE